jgi:hypothetical protein
VRRWLAILTAAGAMGTTTQAHAALYYWPDYSDGSYFSRQPQSALPRPKPPRRRGAATSKKTVAEKETGPKPQGPLVIAISIDRQKVTVYDSNGVFAEAPVSTGMKGHPTPMGVFSVIQKHKFHRSNIYSNAPMPYMQRITWSGVAMHAGVLPGYPASHGCIRMPMAFAVKMWNWTKMGARVIVTPGEMTPSSFSHPLLASSRVPPQPAASLEPQVDAPLGAKADKGADKGTPEIEASGIRRASAEPVTELKSVGPTVMSDATTGSAPAHDEAGGAADETASTSSESAKTESSAKTADASEPAKLQSEKTAAKSEDTAPARPAEATETEAKPAAASDAPKANATAEDKPAPNVEPVKNEQVVPEPPSQPASTTTDAKKDQTRLAEPAAGAKPAPPKRAGQIAVFISRKDSKMYVRQNFSPLFDVPVTIVPSDRPLGTHVFTAEVDRNDANALHWSVVSLPVASRSVEVDDDRRVTRRQRGATVTPVAAKPVIAPDNPTEALDRISIPADNMAKVNELLTTGASIIVSDQGINQGETGEGTDFIVRLR